MPRDLSKLLVAPSFTVNNPLFGDLITKISISLEKLIDSSKSHTYLIIAQKIWQLPTQTSKVPWAKETPAKSSN
jgi:hypothetical protein